MAEVWLRPVLRRRRLPRQLAPRPRSASVSSARGSSLRSTAQSRIGPAGPLRMRRLWPRQRPRGGSCDHLSLQLVSSSGALHGGAIRFRQSAGIVCKPTAERYTSPEQRLETPRRHIFLPEHRPHPQHPQATGLTLNSRHLSPHDSPFQIRRAACSAALPRAGLRHRRLHHLLQPASAGGDGQNLRRARRPRDVCRQRHAGRLRAGIAVLCAPGRSAGAPRADEADVRRRRCGAASGLRGADAGLADRG